MTADQTSFAKSVQHLGLERGIERSRATHTSIKQHYAAIERGNASSITISPETVEPKVLKKGIFTKEIESPGQVAERLTAAVKEAYQPMAANAAVSAQERRRAKELQDTAKEQRSRLERLQEPFKGLSKEQVANVLAVAMKYQRENVLAKEAKKAQILERFNAKREQSRDRGGISR